MSASIRHLRYFVTVVDAGSFSRAATIIHIAQPALSRQVHELEEIVGAELLHRTPRGIRPTAAGEALYREALAILNQMDRLRDAVQVDDGDVEGAVSVGMSSTLAAFLGGPFMEVCKARFPRLTLRLITSDSDALKARLDAGRLDIAALFEDEPAPGFVRVPLFRQRLYLIGRSPIDSGAQHMPIARLAELPLILPARPNVLRAVVDRATAEADVPINIVGEADVFSGVMAAVHAGIGFSILPKGDFSDVPGYGSLYALAIEPPIFLTAYLLNSCDRPAGRAVALVRDVFVDFSHDMISIVPPPGAQWIADDSVMPGEHGGIAT